MYATGKGVTQNYQNAIFYWQQAATQGNENAKKALQLLAEMEQKENADYRKKTGGTTKIIRRKTTSRTAKIVRRKTNVK